MAQTAKTWAKQSKWAALRAADVMCAADSRVENVAHRGLHVVQRMVGAVLEVERPSTELGQALVGLLQEQSPHNLKTLTELAGAIGWDQVAWDQLMGRAR